jgi:hypothetical protein
VPNGSYIFWGQKGNSAWYRFDKANQQQHGTKPKESKHNNSNALVMFFCLLFGAKAKLWCMVQHG